jgi:hypothetical protein
MSPPNTHPDSMGPIARKAKSRPDATTELPRPSRTRLSSGSRPLTLARSSRRPGCRPRTPHQPPPDRLTTHPPREGQTAARRVIAPLDSVERPPPATGPDRPSREGPRAGLAAAARASGPRCQWSHGGPTVLGCGGVRWRELSTGQRLSTAAVPARGLCRWSPVGWKSGAGGQPACVSTCPRTAVPPRGCRFRGRRRSRLRL